jgi:hypothetical protein
MPEGRVYRLERLRVMPAAHPRVLASSRPRVLASSRPHVLASSRPRVLASSRPSPGYETIRPQPKVSIATTRGPGEHVAANLSLSRRFCTLEARPSSRNCDFVVLRQRAPRARARALLGSLAAAAKREQQHARREQRQRGQREARRDRRPRYGAGRATTGLGSERLGTRFDSERRERAHGAAR